MSGRRFGFTIVELAITIAVIGILVAVGTFSFLAIQQQARDNQRSASAQTIANALERYYEENGEYPGCEALTANPSIVSQNTLKSIDTAALRAPKAAAGVNNSLSCQALESVPSNTDIFSYTGDTSAACQTGPACAKWEIRYRMESGEIGSIKSKHTAEAIAVTPTLTATGVSVSQINTSWTAAQDAVSYELQRSTTAGFSSPTTTSHTNLSSAISGLSPSTTYYFRVRAVLPSSTSNWSAVVSAQTLAITTPTGTIGIVASISGTDARGTANGGTCASGTTIQYQMRYNVNDGAYSAYVIGSPLDVAATEGYKYTFQAQARCVVGGSGSSWTTSSTVSIVRPVAVPTDLTITAAMSGTNARGTAAATCASGTTPEHRIQYRATNTTAAGTWSGYVDGGTRDVPAEQGYQYTFQQLSRCVGQFNSSGYAMSSTSAVVRPINAPAAPTVTVSGGGASSTNTYTRTNVTCPTGTTIRYQYRNLRDGGYTGSWYTTSASSVSVNTTSQGYEYTTEMHAQCYTTYATSDWGSSGSASYIRPVDPDTAYSFNAWREGNDIIYMTIYSPSGNGCGPGASLYGRYDIYTYDWYWMPSPNYYGWRRTGAHGWISGPGYSYQGSMVWTGVTTANPTGGWWGSRWATYAELRCQNSATGRNSGSFIGRQSPTLQP